MIVCMIENRNSRFENAITSIRLPYRFEDFLKVYSLRFSLNSNSELKVGKAFGMWPQNAQELWRIAKFRDSHVSKIWILKQTTIWVLSLRVSQCESLMIKSPVANPQMMLRNRKTILIWVHWIGSARNVIKIAFMKAAAWDVLFDFDSKFWI